LAFFDRKDDYHFLRWAREVKQRDQWTCQICNRRGVELNSHHLNSWDVHPDERYDIENGTCLCRFHHDDFHEKYGRGRNTKEQFSEYQQVCEAIIKAANENESVERHTEFAVRMLDGYALASKILEDLDGYSGPVGYV
jgi:hypothetical protein